MADTRAKHERYRVENVIEKFGNPRNRRRLEQRFSNCGPRVHPPRGVLGNTPLSMGIVDPANSIL